MQPESLIVEGQRAAARICLALLIAAPAFGQESARDTAELTLEEVVVTAQKRTQPIQQVPISVAAYSGNFLDRTGAGTLEDVSRLSPGFAIANGSQQTNSIISIRGIGSVGNNAIEPSVGVFIDGVYYPRAGSVIGQLLDIESVEVLRGPQGTLFGRNTPVGALNITTRTPTPVTSGLLQAGLGDDDAVELAGIINGGLGRTAAGRLAIRYAGSDGPWHNMLDERNFGARDDVSARARLSFNPSARLSMLMTVDYAHIDASGGAIEVLNASVGPAFDARLNALYGSTATTADPHDGRINQVHEDALDDEQGGVSFDLRYQIGSRLQLRSISAWRDWRADALESAIRVPADILPRFTYFDTRTVSQELQLLSPGGEQFDWMTGLFLYKEDYAIEQGFDAGQDFCMPTVEFLFGTDEAQECLGYPQQRFVVSNFNQDLGSIALFGQGTWRINEQLTSTLGLRWTRDRKRADFVQVTTNPYASLLRANEEAPGMRQDDSQATWFANLSWSPARHLLLFATAATGYKSGGFNSEGAEVALGSARREFFPESSTNFELGLKSTLLAGRMTANLAAFRTDLEDFQDRAFDGISFRVLNVGKLRQQGLEADLRWRVARPLSLAAGATYLDSRYLSFPAAPPLPGATQPQDLTGARKTISPKWRFAADADLTLPLATDLQWFVGAGVQYTSAQNIGLISNDNPQTVQQSYALLQARAGVQPVSGHWDLTLFGTNLSGKGYCLAMGEQPFGTVLGAVDAANSGAVQRCILGAPRSWRLRLSWRF
jgi:iron complex outermembrane receptor protein